MAAAFTQPGELLVHRIVELNDLDSFAPAWDRLAEHVRQPDRSVHLGAGLRRGSRRPVQPVRAGDRSARGAGRRRPAGQAARPGGPSRAARRPRAPGADGLPVHGCRRSCGAGSRPRQAPGPFEPEALPGRLAGPGGGRGRLPKARPGAQSRCRRLPRTSPSASNTGSPSRRSAPAGDLIFGVPNGERRGSAR